MEEITYNTTVCPYCGNKAKRPETGNITETPEKWQAHLDDDKFCIIYEKIDENDYTIGYGIWCKER